MPYGSLRDVNQSDCKTCINPMTNISRKQDQPYKGQADLNQLNALLGEEDPITLPLTAIVLPETQPRRYFNPEKLAQLTDSIKAHGILENLVV